MNDGWTWAKLDGHQLQMIQEAEHTIGSTDYILAYQSKSQAMASGAGMGQMGVRVANLNESQVECLQGLEKQLQAVGVAYRHS